MVTLMLPINLAVSWALATKYGAVGPVIGSALGFVFPSDRQLDLCSSAYPTRRGSGIVGRDGELNCCSSIPRMSSMGADRVLGYIFEFADRLRASNGTRGLPSDPEHGAFPLCERIEAQGVRVDHVPLPILRRANLTPVGLTDLARRSAAFRRHCARLSPATVYGTTSATLPSVGRADRGPHTGAAAQPEVWKPKEAQILAASPATSIG